MTKTNFTYRLNWLLPVILILEVCFVLLLGNSSVLFSFWSDSSSDVVFVKEENFKLYWYTLLLPGVWLFHAYRYNRKLGKFQPNLLQNLFNPVSSILYFLRYLLLRLAFYALILALAQPAFGKKKSSGTRESLELVVCIDISNSMNVRDISEDLSRLDITKRALNQLVNQLHGERIGICIFANTAFVQLPVTHDYGAAKLFLEDIETNMISNQGTNIKAALETSAKMFSPERTGKGILLITDGENHEENPSKIFAELKEKKVDVMVMGIGTATGGLVPNDPHRPELGYKKNAMGSPVHSKLNQSFLSKLAQQAGTELMIADSEFPDLSVLLTQINHLKRIKIDNLEFEIKEEQYQIPLFLALICWFIFLLLQYSVLKK